MGLGSVPPAGMAINSDFFGNVANTVEQSLLSPANLGRQPAFALDAILGQLAGNPATAFGLSSALGAFNTLPLLPMTGNPQFLIPNSTPGQTTPTPPTEAPATKIARSRTSKGSGGLSDIGNKIGDILGTLQDKLSGAVGNLGDKLGGLQDKLSGAVGNLGDKLGGLQDKLSGALGNLGDKLGGLTAKLGNR